MILSSCRRPMPSPRRPVQPLQQYTLGPLLSMPPAFLRTDRFCSCSTTHSTSLAVRCDRPVDERPCLLTMNDKRTIPRSPNHSISSNRRSPLSTDISTLMNAAQTRDRCLSYWGIYSSHSLQTQCTTDVTARTILQTEPAVSGAAVL